MSIVKNLKMSLKEQPIITVKNIYTNLLYAYRSKIMRPFINVRSNRVIKSGLQALSHQVAFSSYTFAPGSALVALLSYFSIVLLQSIALLKPINL